jgi:hypothetical protein
MAFPSKTGPNSYIWKLKDVYNARQGDNWPSPPPFPGARGVFGGGQVAPSSWYNTIDYVTIDSTGNATDFGDLTNSRAANVGVNSLTRGVFGFGNQGGSAGNVLDYITIASTGNATDFGDAVTASFGTEGSACDQTRGIFAGGYVAPTRGTNVIQYITIATTGNATDFGDLTVGRYQVQTQISSPTRGLFAGGNT